MGLSVLAFTLVYALTRRIWWGIAAGLGSYFLLAAGLAWRTFTQPPPRPKPLAQRREPSPLPQPLPVPTPSFPAELPPTPAASVAVTRPELPLNQPSFALPDDIFALPHLTPRDYCDPDKPIWLGEVTDSVGEAVYGNQYEYCADLYYGRVTRGAIFQLLDDEIYYTRTHSPLLKTRILYEPTRPAIEFGLVAWLSLERTNLMRWAKKKRNGSYKFTLTGYEPSPDWEVWLDEPYPAGLEPLSSQFPKGYLVNHTGAGLYQTLQNGQTAGYLGGLALGDKFVVVDPIPRKNQYQLPYIFVEVVHSAYHSMVGKTGWAELLSTNVRDCYNPELKRLQ